MVAFQPDYHIDSLIFRMSGPLVIAHTTSATRVLAALGRRDDLPHLPRACRLSGKHARPNLAPNVLCWYLAYPPPNDEYAPIVGDHSECPTSSSILCTRWS